MKISKFISSLVIGGLLALVVVTNGAQAASVNEPASIACRYILSQSEPNYTEADVSECAAEIVESGAMPAPSPTPAPVASPVPGKIGRGKGF